MFDPARPALWHQGLEVELPDRSLQLLALLLRLPGRTISRDRLIDAVWQGRCVSDVSLTEAVSRLRQALGDDAREPRYIRTMHGRGYRLIAPIERCDAAEGERRPAAARRAALAMAVALSLVGALWVGIVATGDGAAGSKATLTASSDGNPPPSGSPRPRPRYGLAEVAVNGGQLSRFGFPSLPLEDLSVDRAGNRFAFSMANDLESDVWVFEPGRGQLERVTSGGYFSDPVWHPEGEVLAMAYRRGEDADLVIARAERRGSVEVLLAAPLDQFPESWSKDGRSLVYSERHPETGYDLWRLSQRADGSWVPHPIVRTAADEAFGAVSPDGLSVAYVSIVDDRPAVFVTGLTGDGTAVRVSPEGGGYPFWSPAGDQLHYVDGDEVWTVSADELEDGSGRLTRGSTPVAGIYLASPSSRPGRFVVAVLDNPARSRH